MYVTASFNEDISSINSQDIEKRYLLEIRNILGEISLPVANTPLFYIYNDGTVEKKIILE